MLNQNLTALNSSEILQMTSAQIEICKTEIGKISLKDAKEKKTP